MGDLSAGRQTTPRDKIPFWYQIDSQEKKTGGRFDAGDRALGIATSPSFSKSRPSTRVCETDRGLQPVAKPRTRKRPDSRPAPSLAIA